MSDDILQEPAERHSESGAGESICPLDQARFVNGQLLSQAAVADAKLAVLTAWIAALAGFLAAGEVFEPWKHLRWAWEDAAAAATWAGVLLGLAAASVAAAGGVALWGILPEAFLKRRHDRRPLSPHWRDVMGCDAGELAAAYAGLTRDAAVKELCTDNQELARIISRKLTRFGIGVVLTSLATACATVGGWLV